MKLQCVELLSSFAFNFNLRRYNLEKDLEKSLGGFCADMAAAADAFKAGGLRVG